MPNGGVGVCFKIVLVMVGRILRSNFLILIFNPSFSLLVVLGSFYLQLLMCCNRKKEKSIVIEIAVEPQIVLLISSK